MNSLPQNRHYRNMVVAFYVVVALVALYFVRRYLLHWIAPFLTAFVFALLIDPIIRYLTRKLKIKRGFLSAVVVLLFLSGLSFIVYLAGSRLVSEATSLAQNFPKIMASVQLFFDRAEEWFAALAIRSPDEVTGFLETIGDMLLTVLAKLPETVSSKAVALAGPFVSSIPSVLLSVVVTIVATFFLSADLPAVKGFLLRQLPAGVREKLYETKSHLIRSALGLLRAQLTLTSITFCELFIGFLIIGVDYAFLLAILVAVLDALPILGVGGILIPWAVVSLVTGEYIRALSFLILYGIIFVMRQFLEPRIIGTHIGLPPIVTLISIYVGLKMFGLIGAVLLPIIVITLKYLQDKGYVKIWK